MKIGAPDFWKRVAELGSLPTTETPVSASTNVADFWKKVQDGGSLPVTATPLGASANLPDFWMKVAAQGAVPTTSTLVEFTSEADYSAYVAANGVMPISVGNAYGNVLDLWRAISSGVSGAGSAYETPSYDNVGGMGDRTASIVVTTDLSVFSGDNNKELVEGSRVNGIFFLENPNIASKFLRFDFGEGNAPLITEFRIYLADADPQGTWKTQKSDGAISADIGSQFVFDGGAGNLLTVDVSDNTSGARCLDLIGVSGATFTQEIYEVEFKIGNPL